VLDTHSGGACRQPKHFWPTLSSKLRDDFQVQRELFYRAFGVQFNLCRDAGYVFTLGNGPTYYFLIGEIVCLGLVLIMLIFMLVIALCTHKVPKL
jgi:hypothetical protein